jgi:hypothetical protein
MMMRTAMTVALALLVAACAKTPIPMATAAEDAAGKQFAPPPPGFAALYIFRVNDGPAYTILDGQRTLGVLGGSNWLRVELPAGGHNIHCAVPRYSNLVSTTVVPLKAGDIQYLSATLWESGFSCRLTIEDADVGGPAVLRGSRVKEQP